MILFYFLLPINLGKNLCNHQQQQKVCQSTSWFGYWGIFVGECFMSNG